MNVKCNNSCWHCHEEWYNSLVTFYGAPIINSTEREALASSNPAPDAFVCAIAALSRNAQRSETCAHPGEPKTPHQHPLEPPKLCDVPEPPEPPNPQNN
eukprot:2676190-Amphidinium_carterae.1